MIMMMMTIEIEDGEDENRWMKWKPDITLRLIASDRI